MTLQNAWAQVNQVDSPAIGGFAITPSASEFAVYPRAIYVGGDGNVVITTPNDSTITLVGVVAGTILPIRAKKVLATSTATFMVGLY